jgi:hypothetical protein
MGKIFWTLVVVLVASVSLSIATPQGKGRGKGQSTKQEEAADQAVQGRAFGEVLERIIRTWFSDKNNLEGLPPGLAKREQLPPGLQRQLQKNGTLPPGLQKRLQPLPEALERSLPTLPAGLKRGIIGVDLVLVGEVSGEILDVITSIF